MLIGVFKSNQKFVNVFTLLLAILLWGSTLFMDTTYKLSGVLFSANKWVDVLLAVLLITFQSVFLNRMVNEYKLTKTNTHITSLMFLVFNGCFIFLLNFNQIIVANTFVMLALHQLLRVYNIKNSFSYAFNSGLLIAIASLIYFPCVIYFLMVWMVLIYFITPTWRDFIISFLGFCVPLVYFFSYQYLFQDNYQFSASDYWINIFNVHFAQLSFFEKILTGLLTFIGLFAFVALLQALGKMVVRARKMLIIIFLMFILGLGTLAFNRMDYMATFVLVSIPLSIIAANYFLNLKKQWFAELVFFCLMIVIILGYFS